MRRLALLAAFVLAAGLVGGLAPLGESAAHAAVVAHAASAAASGRPAVQSVSPVAGSIRGGTAVTIRGARFSHVKSVLIGGKKARDVHVRSPRVLTAVTPSHAAGTASVIVQARAGKSPLSKARFHYLSRPRLTGVSPSSGLVTGGQTVTISGRHLSYVTAVMFGPLHAKVLPRSTSTRLRVRTPASWADTVQVSVQTQGGTTVRSAEDRFTFRNPPSQLSGKLTPASGDVIASNSDITAVSGGPAFGQGASQAPWQVTLASGATVPGVGQKFLLKPGGSVYPAGLAGTVTAVDSGTSTITVSAGSLDSAVASVQTTFTGPLSSGTSGSTVAHRGSARAGTINFGSIPGTALKCTGSPTVSGGVSLTLNNVDAHVQVEAGSLWQKPFVDVWVSYQPTLAFKLTAGGKAECSLPAAWQNSHEKLIVLGDTGATIAIAPDVTFKVTAGGSVSFQQHSYQIMGFVTNPDGTISRLDGQSADPAQIKVSGELKAEAYAGVQIQVGELNIVGVGMSLGGGAAATVSADWPPQVCLKAYPFLRGTLYAYLNLWVKEWKLRTFTVELDLKGIGGCTGEGWHVAWQSKTNYMLSVACPADSDCIAVGRTPKSGYLLRTVNGGKSWTPTTLTGYKVLYDIACSDASHCIAGGNTGKVAVTANGGASWSQVGLPFFDSPVSAIGSVACLPGGTCYVTAYMTKYSGELVYGSTNSGQTWTLKTVVDNEPNVMTCVSAPSCLAVGAIPPNESAIAFPAASEATRNGWGTAYSGKFPRNWDSLTGVACASLSLCYAGGTDLNSDDGRVLATSDFGKTWKAVPDANLSAWTASCPNSTTCVVAGSAPNWAQYVAETVDGGHSWTKTTISTFPKSDGMFTISLACASVGHCMAVEIGGGPTVIVAS